MPPSLFDSNRLHAYHDDRIAKKKSLEREITPMMSYGLTTD